MEAAAAKVVVIGDIGWKHQYHLGDEAMTEAALQLLHARGITDITLIAGKPEVATAMYGLPAVPRFGFHTPWSRRRHEETLLGVSTLLEAFVPTDGPPQNVIEAVAQADAVVIAGGGNMNSRYIHHLYERVALTRVAKHFGKPLFVTSQTVGPALREPDAAFVREIMDYARCFGAREGFTHELLRQHGGDPERVRLTMDDAVLLTPRPEDIEFADSVKPAGPYVIGSFSMHDGAGSLEADEYYAMVASGLDQIVAALDAEILLVPHVSSLTSTVQKADEIANRELVKAMTSDRVTALPMMTARQVVALTADALLSVSSRYHAAVFAAGLGVPALTLVTSHYSSVRMCGALASVGMEPYALPMDSWQHAPLTAALADLTNPDLDVRGHLSKAAQTRRAEQDRWWDAVAASLRGAEWTPPAPPAEVAPFAPSPWHDEVAVARRISDRLGREIEQLRESLAQAALPTGHSGEQLGIDQVAHYEKVVRELERLKKRRVIRFADKLSKVRRRLTFR